MCLKWLITGYTTGRLWLITSGQLSIYVIIYIDHVVDIDFSEIWLHSRALLMWAEEGDRVGSGLIRWMDASPITWTEAGAGSDTEMPVSSLPCRGITLGVPPRSLIAFSAFYVRFQAFFPAAPLFVLHLMDRRLEPLPPPLIPSPSAPTTALPFSTRGGPHIFRHINHIPHWA